MKFYSDNYKITMKNTEWTLEKGKITYVHGLEGLIILQCFFFFLTTQSNLQVLCIAPPNGFSHKKWEKKKNANTHVKSWAQRSPAKP